MLAYVEWEGMDDVDVHSSESIGKLVYVDDKVVSSGAFAPVKGALFANQEDRLPQGRCPWLLDEYLIFSSCTCNVFVDGYEFVVVFSVGYL
jgi:hypothetical protein